MPDRSPSPPHDLAVFIGRFQPFHLGHLRVIEQALSQARHLLVVIGSAGAARRADLIPFSADERREMILASLPKSDHARLTLKDVPDLSNLAAWAAAVEQAAEQTVVEQGLGPQARTALIGCSKDRSSYYLNAFPGWGSIKVPVRDGLSATPARLAFFDEDPDQVDLWLADGATHALPKAVISWLGAFRAGPNYSPLVQELAWARRYRSAWSAAPYPPTFVTADAVVVQDDCVLLIQRKGFPGRGLWALPGGFVEQDEFVVDAAIRELAEETGLGVSEAQLRQAISATQVFDAPFRDMRGRVITHATLFRLPSKPGGLPSAVAADDAADLRWAPINELRRDEVFGDHFAIIHALVSHQTSQGEG